MKTNQEIAASVFEKSKIVLHKRRQRRKRIAAAASTLGVIALITVAALGSRGVFDKGNIPTADPPSIPDVSSAAVSESSRPIERDSEGTDRITSAQNKDTDSTEITSSESASSKATSSKTTSSKNTSSKTTSSKTTSSKTTSSKTNSSISNSSAANSSVMSSKTTSSKVTSSKTTSSKTTSSKVTSSKTTSSKTTSSKTTSSKVTSSKTTSSKTTSSKVTSSKTTSSKVTSSKTTSSKATGSKTNSSKPTSSIKPDTSTDAVSTETDVWYENSDIGDDAPHSGDSDADMVTDWETISTDSLDSEMEGDTDQCDTDASTDGGVVLAYYISPDENVYSSAAQLVRSADRVVKANVTAVSFEGYNSDYSSITPVLDADDRSGFLHGDIYTTYHINIIDPLDGGNYNIGSFTVYGGTEYADFDMQRSYTNGAFPIIDGMEPIYSGGTFIFLLDYNEDAGVWTLHNYTQSVYNTYYGSGGDSYFTSDDIVRACDEVYG